jgi:hypothetical protein
VSDRLDELRRQRELQREHLEWIDRQIAALEGILPQGPDEAPAQAAREVRSAEDILEEFRQHPAAIGKRTKLGCLLYFAAAMAVLAILAAAFYLHVRSGHARP